MLPNEITIRTASLDDAPEILAIYAPYVVKTAVTFEYEVPALEEFRKRMENTLQKYPYLVAEGNGSFWVMPIPVPFMREPPITGRPRFPFTSERTERDAGSAADSMPRWKRFPAPSIS